MPRTSKATKPSTPRLSEVAKHLAVPEGITATGWPDVERTCRLKLGIEFDPWQDAAGKLILAKRADGHLAAMIDGVGMSLPRQVGKTYLLAALIFGLCVNTPGLLVIWSAHHARTHGETFLAMQGFAQRAKVAPFVDQVFKGSGDEEIRFHNGSRILFGARERGFGRGIPGVDILIMDEAQILSDRAMSNMLATLNTSQFGLQLYIGTPPKPEDMSEAFTRMRMEALAGTLHDGAWIEFGADDDAADDDRSQWSKANPSYPKRTPVQSMLRLRRKLTADDWRREGLGIWGSMTPSATDPLLPGWSAICDPDAVLPDGASAAWSIDVQWLPPGSGRKPNAWVSAAVDGEDGKPVVQVVHVCDPADVVAWLDSEARKRPFRGVAVQGNGAPASALINDLRSTFDEPKRELVVAMTGPQLSQACTMAATATRTGAVSCRRSPVDDAAHALDVALDLGVNSGLAKELAGAWVVDRVKSPVDTAPVTSWINAHWLLKSTPEPVVEPGVWFV